MCGCSKKTASPVTQSRAAQSRTVTPRPFIARTVGSITDLAYHGTNATQDLVNVPTGAHYVVRNGIATVFQADVEALLARRGPNGEVLFSQGQLVRT